ncbi:MAG: glycosyltransferase [Pseudomonadota bacterium]
MSDAPLVSVVMPVWNAGAYLSPAVESILAQSLADFELIAVDDGSTDGSARVLAATAARDSRVRVITQENKGLIAALNVGTAAVRGRYIARMDNDDIAYPDRFARQVAAMDADPDLVALGSQIRLIDPEGRALRPLHLPLKHEEIDREHIGRQRMGLCHPATMIRADVFARIGPYRHGVPSAEDIDLWLRLAEVGRLANLEDCLLDYRQHAKSIGYMRRHEQNVSAWKAAQAAAARRGVDFTVPAPTTKRAAKALPAQAFQRWGWWALGGGEIATARYYARKALLRHPFAVESWKLAYCAIRGH